VERDQITVRVLKYDGTEYRRWKANLSCQEGALIILNAEFDIDVSHEVLGEVKQHTRTVEYYWWERWYNVFRFLQDDGSTRLWYCNINMPLEFADEMLTYIDLDIDILVQPDLSYQVLDMEEFEINAERYQYSTEHREQAHKAVDEVIRMIQARQFPFQNEVSSLKVQV
jgi:protein associated with RNAse G/E